MRSTAKKTYGKTARKAEPGYEIEGMPDRTERLRLLAKRLRRADGLDRDVLERIEALTEIREEVHRIAVAHRASNVRLLGSTGREKQNASSSLGLSR